VNASAAELSTYDVSRLAGVVALCEAEGWTSYAEDPDRTHAVLTAPGVTTVVALVDEQVAGFAYLQSDGQIQAHLSLIAVSEAHGRRGIARRPSPVRRTADGRTAGGSRHRHGRSLLQRTAA
jgi:hypothetical protein